MDILEQLFRPNPCCSGMEMAKWRGYSIIRGPFITSAYEVMDHEGETHGFNDLERLWEFVNA